MITMSQKQISRISVLDRLIADETFTIAQAAETLGLTTRHVIRLKGAYKTNGIDALVHKNIGRSPSHAISESTRKEIVRLKETPVFARANFKHFREILEREEIGIKVGYASLHEILTCAGIKSPKNRRPSKKHPRRKRKAKEGMMLQMDASPFDWLNTGQMCEMHGAIDDATGKVTGLYLCRHECLQGYLEITREGIYRDGIPLSIYADRHAIFVSPKDGKLSIEDQLKGFSVNDTQFGRALKQLGITLIKARTPQAKGRIERLWETLQSRLPVEFALKGITTIDEANTFLADYIVKYNEMFAVEAEDPLPVYRSISPALNIENILCVIENRKFDNGGIFSFHNKKFKILFDNRSSFVTHRGNIDVLVSPIFGVRASFAGITYDVAPYVEPQKAIASKKSKSKNKPYIPPDTHYYKYGHNLVKRIFFDESDMSILKMLERIFLWRINDAV